MSLIKDMYEAVQRLTQLVAEETEALETRSPDADLKALAAEKAQLADHVEQFGEAMKRAGKAALDAEPPAARAALKAEMQNLALALEANARVLERRKSLSEGMINSVLSEAKRQAGTRLAGYGPGHNPASRAAAIAFNSEA